MTVGGIIGEALTIHKLTNSRQEYEDRIVELLRDDGVDIARRTVAKYREALRIPSSVQRRREKAMLVALPARG
jgi:DNA-directed RNA polymerase specialized sigma54-like protein